MFKDLFFAIRFLITLRRTDAMYVVFKKNRSGQYEVLEQALLKVDRRL